MHGFYNIGFGIGHISMMLFWLVLIGLIVWVVFSPKMIHSIEKDSPLDIAKRRYARGEISQKELEEIKRNL